ncbi:MAG: DNA repair protein RecN, partial [Armatimonadetes bacterium]|nr:DNA repair protein RecN [Armatimonadota bacterium]
IAEEAGIPVDDGAIIITRLIAPGRSRYWVNRRPATQALVQDLNRHLLDIHGQHEHQALLHEPLHLRYLDEFAGEAVAELLARYRQVYEHLLEVRRELDELRLAERERAQREDLLRFQVKEIRSANLQPGEEESLGQERRLLQNLGRITEAVAGAMRKLGGEELGAVDMLEAAAAELSAVAEHDQRLADIGRQIDEAAIIASEARRSLEDFIVALEFEPGRADEVESRLAEIRRLKRKYGDSIEEILRYAERAEEELARLETSEERIAQLEKEVSRLENEAGALAEELSKERHQAAEKLEGRIMRELAELGMKRAVLKVELQRAEDAEGLPAPDGSRWAATADGIDRVRFLLAANPGEAPKPLRDVASGGELSRVMLAFKTVCRRGAEIPTLVFDEIDVGIGGLTGHAVGRKLAELGQRAQVICVTHLAQIACRADHHIVVEKITRRDKTAVTLRVLADRQEQVDELARMLGACPGDPTATEHAQQMLEQAAEERRSLRTK